jgi:hypothetical protein
MAPFFIHGDMSYGSLMRFPAPDSQQPVISAYTTPNFSENRIPHSFAASGT